MIPSPWEAALIALAAYRLWRLIAEDEITDPLRDRLLGNEWASKLVECPWCLGAWVTAGWWGAWWAWPDALVVAVPFALSAAVGLVASVDRVLTNGD